MPRPRFPRRPRNGPSASTPWTSSLTNFLIAGTLVVAAAATMWMIKVALDDAARLDRKRKGGGSKGGKDSKDGKDRDRSTHNKKGGGEKGRGQPRENLEDDSDIDFPPAPVSSPGHWELVANFRGQKSFGYFVCDGVAEGCSEQGWKSAHAYPNKWQVCRTCSKQTYPCFMWQNDRPARWTEEGQEQYRKEQQEEKERKEKESLSDAAATVRPHEQTKCQMCCELGVGCWTITREERRQMAGRN